jgi:hypothetical protein
MLISRSDLGDDPHEGWNVVTEADGRVVFVPALAGRASLVARRARVAALLIAVGGTLAIVLGADRILAGAALGDVCDVRHGLFVLHRFRRLVTFGVAIPLAVLAILVLAAGATRRAAAAAGRVLAFAFGHGGEIAVMPLDLGADQLLDGVDMLGVAARRDGEGLA